MSVSDPIADMLTRIRNANMVKHQKVDIPSSNMKVNLANVLRAEGFIKNYKVIADQKQGILRVYLKYIDEKDSVINEIKRVSKPGGRVYVKFALKNRSKADFPVGTVLLGRGITDPKDSDKVLGVEDLQTDEPAFESELIPAGGETKVLLAFDERQVRNADKVVLRVVEESGLGRAVEFKNLKLFTR